MAGSLRVIAKYGTPEEAHLLRNRLEAAGIRVFLDGETTAAWAWHFANALGGVKLLVPEEDLEAAREVLALGDEQHAAASAEDQLAWDQPSDSWDCAECGEEVDLNMDVCWACGATREPAEAPDSQDEAAPEAEPEKRQGVPPEVAFLTILFPPTFAYFLFTKLCHLLAPLVPDARHHASTDDVAPEAALGTEPDAGRPKLEPAERMPEAVSTRDEQELDALVLRAWRAALMGFFLLPPLLMTLYSTWLLVQYWFRRQAADRRRDRLALSTLGVNVAAALCLGVLLWWAIGGLIDRVRYEPGTIGPVQPERAPYLGH